MASKPDLGIHVRLDAVSARHSAGGAEPVVVGPLSLEIGRGEFLSIVGPNGCGKSLLLRVIAGLEPLSSGRLHFVGAKEQASMELGFVFRDSVLFPWRSVLDNVMLGAEIRDRDRKTLDQRARHLIAAMSLAGFEDRMPSGLHPDEAQRAAICRALLHTPPLLLLDDPFGSLDFAAREHLVSDFQRLWMASRFATVLATGDISEAVQLSDRVVLLSRSPGRILHILEIELARPRRLDKATTPQIAEYCSRIRTVFNAQGLPY